MTTLIVLRHGETSWNRDGRWQGQADVELSDVGRAQARAAARHLADVHVDAVWSSPLARALETARTVAHPHGLDVHVDDRLGEINVGEWAGRTVAEVCEVAPEQRDLYERGVDFRRSVTGETATEVGERGAAAFEAIRARHPDETVLVVCHGFFARTVISRLIGLPGYGSRLGGLGNARFAVLRHLAEQWRLQGYDLGGEAT
ncbi:histidine phosphatase family protein [uncultured Tessaracoccus sp.]|uniref:histidine phosphatase family protein n=1 Tax=uncultured Tessaracoccus sp. TaxID=905023 RepID=UPI0025FD5A69|nr:histidine phosphatase family protein [uncultured Tessaracoccus sp.]